MAALAVQAQAWRAPGRAPRSHNSRRLRPVFGRSRHQLWPVVRKSNAQPRARHAFLLRSSDDESAKVLKETAALDELIELLLDAKSQNELAKNVADNIFSFDAKFWLRMANRNDATTSAAEKERLQVLANSVMILLDAMMKSTEQKLSDSAKILQDILASAADEKGEWYLPLSTQQVGRMRAALDRHSDSLDEALLSSAFAYIRKCNDDRFDTMAALIQKALQLYAARALRGPEVAGVAGRLNDVLWAEEQQWEPLLKNMVKEGTINEPDFMEALQRKMEAAVLGLQSGSYAQRVQAEYLKEVEARAKAVFKELVAAQ